MPFKDKEKQRAYYLRHQKAYDAKYKQEHREEWNAYQKEWMKGYRKTEKYRKAVLAQQAAGLNAAWSRNYMDKVREDVNQYKREQTSNLDTYYVERQLVKDGVSLEVSRQYPALVEAKKLILSIKRICTT